jgi:hypothetical protein
MDKMSNNNLMIIMMLITFLVLGASVLVGKSLVTGILYESKVLKAKNTADKNVKEDVKTAPNLMSAYSALGTQSSLITDALPNTSDYPGLLIILENMTNDAGVKLKSVTPLLASATAVVTTPTAGATTGTGAASGTDATQAPTPQPYDFTVQVDGRYDTVLKMLDHLQKSARPMRMTSMTLSGSGGALSAQMDVETYYQSKAELPFGEETIK